MEKKKKRVEQTHFQYVKREMSAAAAALMKTSRVCMTEEKNLAVKAADEINSLGQGASV